MKRNPFARLLLFYASGIVASPLYKGAMSEVGVPVALGCFVGILYFTAFGSKGYHSGKIAGILSFVLLFFIGGWASTVDTIRSERAGLLPATEDEFRILILNIPDHGTGTIRATARILTARSDTETIVPCKILVYFTNGNEILPEPGSIITSKTRLIPVPKPLNPNEFDYSAYMAVRHIYRQVFLRPGTWKSTGEAKLTPATVSCRTRNLLMRCYGRADLTPESLALLSALTLGYRDDVDAATEKAFSRAGVMHIMALSGFNVGMIASVILFLSGGFRKRSSPGPTPVFITLVLIWGFVFVTGLSPSVTRAAVMITLALYGSSARYRVNTANVLLASGFIMLSVSPHMLFDAGFQLSFSAVSGILMFEPFFVRLLEFRSVWITRIWQLFVLSCSAQLATLPFTLYYFHQFPLYFWLTNLYVVPLVSVIICSGMLFLIVCWWAPATILGKALGFMLKGLVFSVTLTEHLPGSLIEPIVITPAQSACLIAAILCFAGYMAGRGRIVLHLLLGSLILFQINGMIRNFRNDHQQVFMVASVKKQTAILFASRRDACLILNPPQPDDDARLTYALRGFFLARGISPEKLTIDSGPHIPFSPDKVPQLAIMDHWRGGNWLLSFRGKAIAIMCDNRFVNYHTDHTLKLDYLVISKGCSLPADQVLHEVLPGIVILDGTVPASQRKKWIQNCSEKGISCHSVLEKGAFLME